MKNGMIKLSAKKCSGNKLRLLTSRLIFVLTIILLCGGVAVRSHSLERSLWLDEAWVANSVYATSIQDMFWGGNWLQTSPPLFMIILRIASHALGYHPEMLRIVPCLFGILSLFLFIYLSRRILSSSFSLFACSLFFYSPEIILNTLQLKQYSSDIFTALALIILINDYITKPSQKRFYITTAIACILLLLSYQAIVFTPLLIACSIIAKNTNDKYGFKLAVKYSRLCFSLFVILGTCAINYFFFIAPNSAHNLTLYWKSGFPVQYDLLSLFKYYKDVLIAFISPIPFKTPFLTWDKEIVFLFFIAGLLGLILSRNNQKHKRLALFLILTIPTLTILMINFFGKFPLRHVRLSLFLAPIFILGFVLGTQYVADIVIRIVQSGFKSNLNTSALRKAFGVILCIMVIIVTIKRVDRNSKPFLRTHEEEDVKGAMNYIASESAEDDILYVHASMREQFSLYSKIYPIRSKQVILGDIGWPCCTRNNPMGSSEKTIASDISIIKSRKEKTKLRLLFTGRPGHWIYLGRSDPELFHDIITSMGCRRDDSIKDFWHILIEEYSCK